jgi:serine/threonine protein kinase
MEEVDVPLEAPAAVPAAAPLVRHQVEGKQTIALISSLVPGLCWNVELMGCIDDGGCAEIWPGIVLSGHCSPTLTPEYQSVAAKRLIEVPGKCVILKLAKPYKQTMGALEREVSLMFTMHGVNQDLFVEPYDQGVLSMPGTDQDGRGWIMMEAVPLGSLLQYVRQVARMGVRMDPERVRVVMKQVAYALSLCHLQGILHRDVKAANVLVVSDALLSVKLADFGVARILPIGLKASTAVGTPGWMAYEVEISEKDDIAYHDYCADSFSLGSMLLEIRDGGKVPYQYLVQLIMIGMISKEEGAVRYGNKAGELDRPDCPYSSLLLPLEKDFVRLCLQTNLERRPTVLQLMSHPYLTGGVPLQPM